MPALGLTDHGVLNGAVEFYKACRKHDVKPILGLEAYLCENRHDREKVRYERNHLTLLARNEAGFQNLIKLSSLGYLDGFRRGQANVDMELLDRHSEGVIALSGCLQSRFCQRIVQEREQEARAHADELMGVFGADNVYFEVQNNKIPEQDRANEGIVRIAREVGRPLVGTADVHYLRREDYSTHSALLCVQTKSTLAQPKLRFDTNEFYLKSPEEMAESFAQWPEAVPDLARDRRALRHRAGARQHDAADVSRPRTAPAPTAYLRQLTEAGTARALRRPAARRRGRAARDRAARDRGHGLRVVLPDRVGLRQVREGQRHRGRPRPWLRRRLDRQLRRCASPTSTRSHRTCCSSGS